MVSEAERTGTGGSPVAFPPALEAAGYRSSAVTPTVGPERFNLLATALAGRRMEVAVDSTEGTAWTDGATIFLAGVEDGSSFPVAAVVLQAALLGAGSLDAEIVAALGRDQGLAARYLAVEGHRALSSLGALVPPSVRRHVDLTVASRSGSPTESLALARSRPDLPPLPDFFGALRPRRLRRSQGAGTDDDQPQRHIPRRDDDTELRELDEEGDADEQDTADIFSSPVGGGGGLGRLLKKLFSEGRSRSSGPPGADPGTRWSRRGRRSGRAGARSATAEALPDGTTGAQLGGFTYPEWDHRRHRYRKDWCTVVEREPSTSELAPFRLPRSQALRRPLARLGTELERHRRQRDGDEIDVDAAVELRVELAAGSSPDEAVYVDTLRRRRDLSVLLLLDVSGSAGEPGVTGTPVHEHQRAAAVALATALHELGDRVGLYGFRSQGRTAIEVLRLKALNRGLDALALRRVGGLVPGAYTRLGAAIRHGAHVLDRDGGTSRRLLIVCSDGLAYDHGYEPAYGEADARRALAEARRRGIGCLCLSVGADTDTASLRSVFGTAAHASVPKVEQLPGIVGPLFHAALRSADHQRRLSQRRDRSHQRHHLERTTA